MNRVRPGFTLVELLAVLAILAVLTAAAAVSLRLPIQTTRMRLAVEQVSLVDRQMRDHARRFRRPAELTFDLERGMLVSSSATDGAVSERKQRLAGARVDRFASATGRERYGKVTVRFSVAGHAPTYAIRLRTGGATEWLLFVGLTGQTVRIDDEQEITEMFRFLSQRIDVS